MENYNTLNDPEFSEELRKLQTTDKAHAGVFNELFETLLSNDIFLKHLADAMVKKENIIHDVAEKDPEKIPGADVTASLQEQIDKLSIVSLTPTVAADIKTEGGNILYKQGKICTLYAQYYNMAEQEVGSKIILCTLPDSARPAHNTAFVTRRGIARIDPSGEVNITLEEQTRFYLYQTITYIAE